MPPAVYPSGQEDFHEEQQKKKGFVSGHHADLPDGRSRLSGQQFPHYQENQQCSDNGKAGENCNLRHVDDV